MSNNIKNEYIDDLLAELTPTPKETKANIVNKVIGNEKIDELLSDDFKVDLTATYPMIPLSWIRVRAVNDYSKSNIPALSENIEAIGLINPIIVTAENGDDGKRYTICDGERRFTAYKMVYDKAVDNGDAEKIERFKSIQCRILTKEELQHEEAIHRSANDMARDNSVYERIYRYYPTYGYFNSVKNQKEYIELLHGEDGWQKYIDGLINVKFNATDIRKCIALKFKKDYPHLEIGADSIRKYVTAIMDGSPELNKAVMDCIVSARAAIKISTLDKDSQNAVVEKIRSGSSINDAIASVVPTVKAEDVNVDEESPKELNDIDFMEVTYKNIIRFRKKCERVNGLPPKGMTGNQKERLKQMKKIMKLIDVLEEMPI